MGSESGPFEVGENVDKTSSALESNSGQQLMAAQAGSPQFVSSPPDSTITNPSQPQVIQREFDCAHYNVCLTLSAALNWQSFTCCGCSGDVNQRLLWRARQCVRQDKGLACICKLPQVSVTVGSKSKDEN